MISITVKPSDFALIEQHALVNDGLTYIKEGEEVIGLVYKGITYTNNG